MRGVLIDTLRPPTDRNGWMNGQSTEFFNGIGKEASWLDCAK
jgi:hypothetical protein